ncbi:class I SAM-dependent methyltransferase [Bombilactobacillus thymidiniphilus]|uniref:Class I SAM-dependent methyltransferase n=1 Tax=Bombilactobacillus thymidiniphilus TaxID=2923363 RepID=A0ABY4PFA7_9LACO|nr:methyltransferase [Bombilactobacillus thymidiniphilus]UQS84287.1 class I SAM-dependent methyltransferase [Bombilactobacillus thymidiniphilus]
MNRSNNDDNWNNFYRNNWKKQVPLPIKNLVKNNINKNQKGFYIGAGTGRNVIPLLNQGFDIYASDTAHVSIDKLKMEEPDFAERLEVGDLEDVFSEIKKFDYCVCSKVLVVSSLENSIQNLARVKNRIKDNGYLCFELPAIGTDIWTDWKNYSMNKSGSMLIKYFDSIEPKLYLSFNDICEILEANKFYPLKGPTPVDLPRDSYPGGLVRDWIGIAESL